MEQSTVDPIDQLNVDLNGTYLFCEDGKNVYLLSKLCVDGSYVEHLECIKNIDDTTNLLIRNLLGIWSVLVGSFGIAGNLLTLLAIPYAARRKR